MRTTHWHPFPTGALPKDVAQYVKELAQATSNNEAWPALIALTAAAARIGNRAAAIVKRGWTEPAVLWGAIVQHSGTCKSVPLRWAMKPILEAYKAEQKAYAQALNDYLQANVRFEIEYAAWKDRLKKGEGNDPKPAGPVAPVENRLLVNDITCEKLGSLLQENPLGLLLVRDELAAWLGSFDRYSHGKGSDGPTWLSFFDAAPVTIDRKSGRTLFVERAAVSVLGTIQPGTLNRVFGQAERESGLLARLLLVMPPSDGGKWTDAELSHKAAAAWSRTLQRLGDMPHEEDEHRNIMPHWVPLSKDARHAFSVWHDLHMAPSTKSMADDLAAHLAKLKGICVRFALILACLDHAPLVPKKIDQDHVDRAIMLADWFAHEGRRIYAEMAQATGDAERKRLIDWIALKGGSVTVRQVQQALRAYRRNGEAELALQALVEDGLGHWELVEADAEGGRPKRVFVLKNDNQRQQNLKKPNVLEGFVGVGAVGSAKIDSSEPSTNGHVRDFMDI